MGPVWRDWKNFPAFSLRKPAALRRGKTAFLPGQGAAPGLSDCRAFTEEEGSFPKPTPGQKKRNRLRQGPGEEQVVRPLHRGLDPAPERKGVSGRSQRAVGFRGRRGPLDLIYKTGGLCYNIPE